MTQLPSTRGYRMLLGTKGVATRSILTSNKKLRSGLLALLGAKDAIGSFTISSTNRPYTASLNCPGSRRNAALVLGQTSWASPQCYWAACHSEPSAQHGGGRLGWGAAVRGSVCSHKPMWHMNIFIYVLNVHIYIYIYIMCI